MPTAAARREQAEHDLHQDEVETGGVLAVFGDLARGVARDTGQLGALNPQALEIGCERGAGLPRPRRAVPIAEEVS